MLSIGLLCSTLMLLLDSKPLGAIVALEAVDTLGVTAAVAVVSKAAEEFSVVLLEMIGGGLIDGRGSDRVCAGTRRG